MRRITTTFALFVFAVAAWSGCAPEPKITTLEVPPERSGLDQLRSRMLVAMFEQPEKTWFFKVTGPPKAIEKRSEQLAVFFQALEFEGGIPQWKLPPGWSQGEPRPMRMTTLVVQSSPLIEMAISNLSSGQDRLLNVNRWLEQLGLAPIESAQLDQMLVQQAGGNHAYWLFDQTGRGSAISKPPFAGGGGMASSPAVSAANTDDIKFAVPKGWIEGNSSSMVRARLKKLTDAEEVLEMTLIVLPADKNDWVPNVIRWAGQIGIELDQQSIEDQTESIQVDDNDGQQIKLIDESKDEAIIGALVKQDQDAWFIKLKGPREAVQEHLADYQQFLNSIKF